MTLNYPHDGSVVLKANVVVGGSIPSCEIATLPDGKTLLWKKIPHVRQKKIKMHIIKFLEGYFKLAKDLEHLSSLDGVTKRPYMSKFTISTFLVHNIVCSHINTPDHVVETNNVNANIMTC